MALLTIGAITVDGASANVAPNTPQVRSTSQSPVRLVLGGELISLSPSDPRPPAVGLRLSAAVRVRGGYPAHLPISEMGFALSPRVAIDAEGLPSCGLGKLLGRSKEEAMHSCRDALVGHGTIIRRPKFREDIEIAFDDPVVAFNGIYKGQRAILVDHFPGYDEADDAFVIPFAVATTSNAGYSLTAVMPPSMQPVRPTGVGEFNLVLSRQFRFKGERHSYLTASCPPPDGSPITLADVTFDLGATPNPLYEYQEGTELSGSIQGRCPA